MSKEGIIRSYVSTGSIWLHPFVAWMLKRAFVQFDFGPGVKKKYICPGLFIYLFISNVSKFAFVSWARRFIKSLIQDPWVAGSHIGSLFGLCFHDMFYIHYGWFSSRIYSVQWSCSMACLGSFGAVSDVRPPNHNTRSKLKLAVHVFHFRFFVYAATWSRLAMKHC